MRDSPINGLSAFGIPVPGPVTMVAALALPVIRKARQFAIRHTAVSETSLGKSAT